MKREVWNKESDVRTRHSNDDLIDDQPNQVTHIGDWWPTGGSPHNMSDLGEKGMRERSFRSARRAMNDSSERASEREKVDEGGNGETKR